MSDFELKILKRVRFWIRNFPTRQISKKKIFLRSMFLKKKFLRSTTFKKIVVEKQIWKRLLHTKNQFSVHFTPWIAQILRFTRIFKKHDFEEKLFLKSMILNVNFFSKKHAFEWKFFCVKHDFQLNFFCLVRFWIKFFSSCQILN